MGPFAILCRSLAVHDGNGSVHCDVHKHGTVKYRNSAIYLVAVPAMGDKAAVEPDSGQSEDKTLVDTGDADTGGSRSGRSGTDATDRDVDAAFAGILLADGIQQCHA